MYVCGGMPDVVCVWVVDVCVWSVCVCIAYSEELSLDGHIEPCRTIYCILQDEIYCYQLENENVGNRKMVHVPVYMRTET